jgi:hypothetical protein
MGVAEDVIEAGNVMDLMRDRIQEVIQYISGSRRQQLDHSQTVAASSQQMSASMEDVSYAAQELAKMAVELQEAIGYFKLYKLKKGRACGSAFFMFGNSNKCFFSNFLAELRVLLSLRSEFA